MGVAGCGCRTGRWCLHTDDWRHLCGHIRDRTRGTNRTCSQSQGLRYTPRNDAHSWAARWCEGRPGLWKSGRRGAGGSVLSTGTWAPGTAETFSIRGVRMDLPAPPLPGVVDGQTFLAGDTLYEERASYCGAWDQGHCDGTMLAWSQWPWHSKGCLGWWSG